MARNGVVRYQYPESPLFMSFCGVFVPLPVDLQNFIHDYMFCHLMNGSAFDCSAAHMTFQFLLRYTGCHTINLEFSSIATRDPFSRFDSRSVHDVHIRELKKRTWDANDNIMTRCALPLHEVSRVVRTGYCAKFKETGAMIPVSGGEREYKVLPSSSTIESLLVVDANADDD